MSHAFSLSFGGERRGEGEEKKGEKDGGGEGERGESESLLLTGLADDLPSSLLFSFRITMALVRPYFSL